VVVVIVVVVIAAFYFKLYMCKSGIIKELKTYIYWDITPCSPTMEAISAETVARDGDCHISR
jgi:hypothetical protein